MSPLQEAKLWVMGLAGLPKDALHIYVGLAVFLGAAALARRPLGSRLPILFVLLAALAGEIWDVIDTINAGRPIRWSLNWHDVWNTMFWPTVLFLLFRSRRLLKS